ncbi:unnamed protein product [Sphacelaria rigidula]
MTDTRKYLFAVHFRWRKCSVLRFENWAVRAHVLEAASRPVHSLPYQAQLGACRTNGCRNAYGYVCVVSPVERFFSSAFPPFFVDSSAVSQMACFLSCKY